MITSFDTNLISPIEFLLQKAPKTDVEKVACLAYYLSHFRNTHNFTSSVIAEIDKYAGQPEFTKITFAVSNATKCGYLARAPKRKKQLSVMGKEIVNALPDRELAKSVLKNSKS